MSTKQSREAYAIGMESGSIPAFYEEILDVLRDEGHSSSLTVSRILQSKGHDISRTRNVATAMSRMEVEGMINRHPFKEYTDGRTNRPSSVYYIPETPVTEKEIVKRHLVRAQKRLSSAQYDVQRLNERLELLENEERVSRSSSSHTGLDLSLNLMGANNES